MQTRGTKKGVYGRSLLRGLGGVKTVVRFSVLLVLMIAPFLIDLPRMWRKEDEQTRNEQDGQSLAAVNQLSAEATNVNNTSNVSITTIPTRFRSGENAGDTIHSNKNVTSTNDVIVIHNTSETNDTLPRVAFITFAHLEDFSRFEKFIFPALDTFLQPDNDLYYVVLRNETRHTFFNELCLYNTTYAKYCERVVPIFVDCPEGYFGESPCCKQEKGLVEIVNQQQPAPYDFYSFHDDDNYFRTGHLKNFLAQLDPTSIMLLTGNSLSARIKFLGQEGYLSARKQTYHCSTTNREYSYPWGNPIIYTHATLQHIMSGLQAGGLVKQCQAYNVTHDAGNAIFHWMYMIPELRLQFSRNAMIRDRRAFGRHGIGKATKGTKRRSEAMAPTMAEMHKMYVQHGFIDSPLMWHNVSGFLTTRTYHEHGHPSTWLNEWYTSPVRDCIGPSRTAEPFDDYVLNHSTIYA